MTEFGVCEIGMIPVRKEPNHRSEMVSQILFGETIQILEQNNNWSYIKITYDNYLGWIETDSIIGISNEDYKILNSSNKHITIKPTNSILKSNNESLLIPAGSTLPNFNKDENSFKLLNNEFSLISAENQQNYDIISLSKQFINSPYLWGGKTALGIDCSGYVQIIYKMMHITLPRDANEQVNIGLIVNFISESKPGDLAFFDNEEGSIVHVGILISQSDIIHASGKVRVDKFDQQGIYNSELKKYTHKLRVIKRVL